MGEETAKPCIQDRLRLILSRARERRTQMDISKRVKRKQITVLILLMGIIILLGGIQYILLYIPGNPAAELLSFIGVLLFGLGSIEFGLSDFPILKIEKFWENYDINPATSYHIFRIRNEGELELSFQLKDAKFDIKIHEYIPYQTKRTVTKEVFSTLIKSGTPVDCSIHPGEYVMTIRSIGSKKNTGSSFSLKYSFMYRALSTLRDLGLTTLEIGVPLLISGMVLLYN